MPNMAPPGQDVGLREHIRVQAVLSLVQRSGGHVGAGHMLSDGFGDGSVHARRIDRAHGRIALCSCRFSPHTVAYSGAPSTACRLPREHVVLRQTYSWHMRLGVDTYSLRWQGWDAFTLLNYAAGLGLDNVQFSERSTLASLDQAYLESLKQRADDLGLSVELGMLSFDRFSSFFRAEYGSGEQQLADLLRAAHVVGSPIVRCLLGGQAERLGPIPFQQHVEEVLRVLRTVAPLAREIEIK